MHPLLGQFMQEVNRQLREGKPAVVTATYQRLLQAGYDDQNAKTLIACCVAFETNEMIEQNRSFDNARYQQLLQQLPELPGTP